MSSKGILKRVRPSVVEAEDSDVEDYNGTSESGSEHDSDIGESDASVSRDEDDMSGSGSEGEEEGEDDESEDERSESDSGNPMDQLANIDFGTLAKAHSSLARDKSSSSNKPDLEAIKAETQKKFREEFGKRKDLPKPKRTSKNAPVEMSSKKPVSRKREAVPVPVIHARDPRFDPAVGSVDSNRFKKNYAFLDEYREKEVEEMKKMLKKTRSAEEKERLKKEIAKEEQRKKEKARREKTEEILREHKKKERELVKQGKTPYYLKKSEQKKLLLMEQYKNLSEKQLEKVMEKRRKRKASKEKKRMPFARRVAA